MHGRVHLKTGRDGALPGHRAGVVGALDVDAPKISKEMGSRVCV